MTDTPPGTSSSWVDLTRSFLSGKHFIVHLYYLWKLDIFVLSLLLNTFSLAICFFTSKAINKYDIFFYYRESSANPFASPPGPSSPKRTTPVPFNVDNDYLKMLREAQRENSARSSARVSPISSAMMSLSSTCKNTPSASPKSPPNSPNTELANYEENLRGVVVNREPESHSQVKLY